MYVIFDMDGVIIDSEMVYRRGHMNAARLYGLPEDTMLEVSKRVTGVTIEMEHQTMIEAFGHLPQFDRDKVFRACRQYFDYIVETGKMELKPGAEEILRFLKEQEVTLGLASSSPRDLIDKVLGRRGMLQYFEAVSFTFPFTDHLSIMTLKVRKDRKFIDSSIVADIAF